MPRRLLLLALVLVGCGSAAPADLPPPAGPAHSPPLTEKPAGHTIALDSSNELGVAEAELVSVDGPVVVADGRRYSVDRARDRLVAADDTAMTSGRGVAIGSSEFVRTCREPVDLVALDGGRKLAVLCGRERVVELYDARTLTRLGRAPAGTGPARIASDGRALVYVTDVVGDALLVFHLRPRFELIRRVALPGGPYAIAYDDELGSLWITLTARNRLVERAAGSRPVARRSFPTVRAPVSVAVDGPTVVVNGSQVLDSRTR